MNEFWSIIKVSLRIFFMYIVNVTRGVCLNGSIKGLNAISSIKSILILVFNIWTWKVQTKLKFDINFLPNFNSAWTWYHLCRFCFSLQDFQFWILIILFSHLHTWCCISMSFIWNDIYMKHTFHLVFLSSVSVRNLHPFLLFSFTEFRILHTYVAST